MKEIKPNVVFLLTLMATAVLSAGNLLAEEAVAAPAEKKDKPAASIQPEAVQVKDAVPAPALTPEAQARATDPAMQEYRKRVGAMRAPRDKELSAANAISAKVEARRQAIFKENEEAAKLNSEIEEMTKALGEKAAALNKIMESDKEILELNKELAAAYEALRANQRKLRDEVAIQHRERLMVMEKQKLEAEAAAKAKADEEAAKAKSTGSQTEKSETK